MNKEVKQITFYSLGSSSPQKFLSDFNVWLIIQIRVHKNTIKDKDKSKTNSIKNNYQQTQHTHTHTHTQENK